MSNWTAITTSPMAEDYYLVVVENFGHRWIEVRSWNGVRWIPRYPERVTRWMPRPELPDERLFG
jgi:hypothetical protein